MSKVFFSVGMSLDGYLAPDGMDFDHIDDPDHKDWMSLWMQLHHWVFQQQFFCQSLGLGDGGETGRDNEIAEETFNRTGVSIMGKRMFDGGERSWPEEAPFHTPVFVLTHQEREPWERPGGATFQFVNDGIESALDRSRQVVDGKDIRIAGGADTIVQYLNAGLVGEFTIALGAGRLRWRDPSFRWGRSESNRLRDLRGDPLTAGHPSFLSGRPPVNTR